MSLLTQTILWFHDSFEDGILEELSHQVSPLSEISDANLVGLSQEFVSVMQIQIAFPYEDQRL